MSGPGAATGTATIPPARLPIRRVRPRVRIMSAAAAAGGRPAGTAGRRNGSAMRPAAAGTASGCACAPPPDLPAARSPGASRALLQVFEHLRLALLLPVGLERGLPHLEMGEPGELARVARGLEPQRALRDVDAVGLAVEHLGLVQAGEPFGAMDLPHQGVPGADLDLGVHLVDGVL